MLQFLFLYLFVAIFVVAGRILDTDQSHWSSMEVKGTRLKFQLIVKDFIDFVIN